MKVIWACPTYGPMDPQAVVSQRIALMHATSHGVEWLGDASPDRMGFSAARNVIAKAAVESEADAVFWCDSDVILPNHAISSLVLADRPFITGIYFQRKPPHYPLIANFTKGLGADHRGSFNWFIEWPENVVAAIDGCGFGCVLTSTAVLKAITPPWFVYERYSEDFDFCLKAAAAGFQLHVHTGVLCGHLADPVPVTATEFRREYQRTLEETAHGLRDS